MNIERVSPRYTRAVARWLCASSAAALLATPPAAGALGVDIGDLSGSVDTTVSAGMSWRVQRRNAENVALSSGGAALSANTDDGNLNYGEGMTSSLVRFVTEVEVDWRWFGFFSRVHGFFDAEQENGSRRRTGLKSDTRELVGRDVDVLDLYGSAAFRAGNVPGELRLGKQVLSWGEGTFLANGINVINPVDVSKLRVPGAEIRDALLPIPMAVLKVGLSESVSLEVFRAFDWDRTTIDPNGTYFSVNDIAGTDADRAMLGFGAVSDQTPLGTLPPGVGAIVPRARDRNPEGSEYGIAVRAFLPRFDDTEIGIYFINYHSRLPILNATTGAGSGLGAAVAGGYAETGRYFLSYPQDIRLYGLSFNTQLGTTGWTLQGEVSHRRNQPLQVDDLELLGASLTPLRNSADPALSALGSAYSSGPTANQIGSFGDFEDIRGFIRRPVTQLQITAARVFGPTLGADRAILVGEFGVSHVHRMPEKSRLRLDGPATYAGGNESQTTSGLQPVTQAAEHFADATSCGYRLVGRLDFLGIIGGLSLSPRVQFQHDVNDISPGPGGNFLQGRKAITLGLEATYLQDLRFDIAYTGFFGAGVHNLLRDRDFVATSIHYSF